MLGFGCKLELGSEQIIMLGGKHGGEKEMLHAWQYHFMNQNLSEQIIMAGEKYGGEK